MSKKDKLTRHKFKTIILQVCYTSKETYNTEALCQGVEQCNSAIAVFFDRDDPFDKITTTTRTPPAHHDLINLKATRKRVTLCSTILKFCVTNFVC